MDEHSGVRFNLKKRNIRNSLDDVNISSYNSDFLSGLFADVAKITEMVDSGRTSKRSRQESCTGFPGAESRMKKQRTVLNASMNRCKPSSYNLSDLVTSHSRIALRSSQIYTPSPTEAGCGGMSTPLTEATGNARQDSLAFQLDCVAGQASPKISSETVAVVAFPNLPATVSDSSCTGGLTRECQIKQGSPLEKQQKESFGWFVDLDHHEDNEIPAISAYSSLCADLAFQAPTAPNASQNDAAVQWAKAADTVDDVLGDFF